ncbi:MAG: cell division topological specificity factor MinE [Chloroflexi bacterium]|nr:cell division topological specificity factor MinE [Chloroflexota bacterium]
MKLFQRLLGRRDADVSGAIAKERLRLVLASDRTSVAPEVLNQIKDEIIAVISRHVGVDAGKVHVAITQDRNESRLMADIPLLVRSARGRKK